MKRPVKRMLSLLLSLLLVLSLLPISALGATQTDAAIIMSDAFALAEGESLPYEATLTGKITSIIVPYSSTYKNITVQMEVTGYADKTIVAYRVKGAGVENLLVDDIITVSGTITNYKGTVEFAQGCTLDEVIPGAIKRFVRDKDGVKEDKIAFDAGCVLDSLQK